MSGRTGLPDFRSGEAPAAAGRPPLEGLAVNCARSVRLIPRVTSWQALALAAAIGRSFVQALGGLLCRGPEERLRREYYAGG